MMRYRGILSLRFHLFQYLFTFSYILSAQTVSSQDVKLSEERKQGVHYIDPSHNLSTKDKNMIRSNVYMIKQDCGHVCDTSYKSEHNLHKGILKFYFFRIHQIS